MSLFNALTSDDAKPGGTASPTESSGGTPPAAATPLVIKVVGSRPVDVVVTVAGTSEVLQRGLLNPNEGRKFDEAPLNVVASDGTALQVTIYGQVKPSNAQPGERGTWFVPKK